MPIYDYVCESCGHVVEVIHAISAAGPAVCERCGGSMKRALSTPAIVFKGSGWAKKDARDAGRAKAKPAATGEGATSAAGQAAAPAGSDGPAAAEPSGGSTGGGTTKDTPATSASTTTTTTASGGSATPG